MTDESQRQEDMKWRQGYQEGFLAAIDGVKRSYTVNDPQRFADREFPKWLQDTTLRKWPPRIFDTMNPSSR